MHFPDFLILTIRLVPRGTTRLLAVGLFPWNLSSSYLIQRDGKQRYYYLGIETKQNKRVSGLLFSYFFFPGLRPHFLLFRAVFLQRKIRDCSQSKGLLTVIWHHPCFLSKNILLCRRCSTPWSSSSSSSSASWLQLLFSSLLSLNTDISFCLGG